MEAQITRRRRKQPERTWNELLCFACTYLQLSWRRLVLRKWLNIAAADSDYSADTDFDSDSDQEPLLTNPKLDRVQVDADNGDCAHPLPRHTCRKSETFGGQYIGSKEIKVCAATWNVAGRGPPDDLHLDDWLDVDDPADIYVIGFQEVIPLNAGNIFGAEDSRPISKWECKIRESLSRIPPVAKFKCFSDPPSPSRFKSSEDAPYIPDEIMLESGSDSKTETCPLYLLDQLGSERTTEIPSQNGLASLTETQLYALVQQKRRPHRYVRIVSKQMVGIFITVWVCRHLRRHIRNVSVSTVGVGIMGYIGNKGSVSVSMTVHQAQLCSICSHLTSGEKEADAVKRNSDVLEIHRRTCFNSVDGTGLPKTIYDHEKIFWLGDLNYRINLPYERAMEAVSKKDWSKLLERDQLKKELQKGGVFDGWYEGDPNFPPTYKYEFDSEIYHQGDPKAVRRTPAWCDRILSFGTGIKLLRYRRSEHKLSDHRPVSATYSVEVGVFLRRKLLQRALSFTDAASTTKQ